MPEEMHLKPSAVGLRLELSSRVSTLPTGQEVLGPIPSTAKQKSLGVQFCTPKSFLKYLIFHFL